MDHIVKPKILTQAALECLTMLCSMSGAAVDDNDDDGNKNGNSRNGRKGRQRVSKSGNVIRPYGKDSNDSICKSILLDLIATLPDIIDEDTSSFKSSDEDEEMDGHNDNRSIGSDEEEDTMTMILST